MRTLSIILTLLFAFGVAYSVPFVIEGHTKQKVTVTKQDNDRGGGRGTIICTPPPK